jgi:hypothetical protein
MKRGAEMDFGQQIKQLKKEPFGKKTDVIVRGI